ncbi:Fc receptor-like protein 5 [Pseudophryne corroboree]|uniref:Fc receptor-like protein 5 n=1 Tax=Pseudophryne corroboree TaxID=495146 RepID=UPI0030813625
MKLREFGSSATYIVPSAQLEDSGNYSCAVRNSSGSVRKTSLVSIQVEELFSTPEVRTNQSSVTEGDEMTLTCDTRRHPARAATELEFAFYRDGWNEQDFSTSDTYSVTSAKEEDSGNYTCEVRTPCGRVRKRSDALSIQIEALFDDPEIRTNRSLVTEGDEMTLVCDTRRNPVTATTELEFAFYRYQRRVQEFNVSATYRVPVAQLRCSGNYTCEVRTPRLTKRSDVLSIQIQAPFNYPVIRTNQSSVTEGDDMTLTCDIIRHPARAATELAFAFYRDGRIVQEFSASDTYSIPAAHLEDSGYYACQVMTRRGSMMRRSNEILIQIEPLLSTPVIRNNRSPVIEGDEMTLTCQTTRYPVRSAYRAEQSEQDFNVYDTYSVPSSQQVASGDYTSDVRTSSRGMWAMKDTVSLEFAFYRNSHVLQNFSASATYSVPAAQPVHSGYYACEVRTPSGSVRKWSNMLNIEVQALVLSLDIIQAGYEVTEGEVITMSCRVQTPAAGILDFAFYRNGYNVQEFSASNAYTVYHAKLEDSGNYTCVGRTPSGIMKKRSGMKRIQVAAQFDRPRIKISPSSVTEGDEMTLTCDPRRYCGRSSAELEFAFYRDGQNVQEFSASDTYSIPAAQPVHSGNYTCDVRTPSDSVRKESMNVLLVQVEEKGLPLLILLGAIYGSLAVIIFICVLLAWKCRYKKAERNIAASTSKIDNSPATYAVVAPTES